MAPYIHLSYKTFFSVSLSKKRKKDTVGQKVERKAEAGGSVGQSYRGSGQKHSFRGWQGQVAAIGTMYKYGIYHG